MARVGPAAEAQGIARSWHSCVEPSVEAPVAEMLRASGLSDGGPAPTAGGTEAVEGCRGVGGNHRFEV